MARITMYDCLERIPNHFNLVLVLAYRVRQLSMGHSPLVSETERERLYEIALREVATGAVGLDILTQSRTH